MGEGLHAGQVIHVDLHRISEGVDIYRVDICSMSI